MGVWQLNFLGKMIRVVWLPDGVGVNILVGEISQLKVSGIDIVLFAVLIGGSLCLG